MPLMRDIDTHGDFEAPAEADGDKKDAKDDDAMAPIKLFNCEWGQDPDTQPKHCFQRRTLKHVSPTDENLKKKVVANYIQIEK